MQIQTPHSVRPLSESILWWDIIISIIFDNKQIHLDLDLYYIIKHDLTLHLSYYKRMFSTVSRYCRHKDDQTKKKLILEIFQQILDQTMNHTKLQFIRFLVFSVLVQLTVNEDIIFQTNLANKLFKYTKNCRGKYNLWFIDNHINELSGIQFIIAFGWFILILYRICD